MVGQPLADPWPKPAPSLCDLATRMFERGAAPTEVRVSLDDERRLYQVLALPADASGDALLVIADVTEQERRHRAEREFVANAAHQLRTPVSAIASAIEVLQGGGKEDPETRDRFLAHLDRECDRLVRLTRALLLLARAQALAEAPAVEVVPLRPLLVSIAGALRPGEGVRGPCRVPLRPRCAHEPGPARAGGREPGREFREIHSGGGGQPLRREDPRLEGTHSRKRHWARRKVRRGRVPPLLSRPGCRGRGPRASASPSSTRPCGSWGVSCTSSRTRAAPGLRSHCRRQR